MNISNMFCLGARGKIHCRMCVEIGGRGFATPSSGSDGATSDGAAKPAPNHYYGALDQEILKFKQELRFKRKSDFQHRYLRHSIYNLSRAKLDMEHRWRTFQGPSVSDDSQIPTTVSLEVFSDGTTHLSPSVFIRTPTRSFLFNCPEGSLRFLPEDVQANARDLFITRARWENIGGIITLLQCKARDDVHTRLHGPQMIKEYLRCMKASVDADFGPAQYPAWVEERIYDRGHYEDPALRVSYIPIFESTCLRKHFSPEHMVDVAFLVELNARKRHVDRAKITELKVPRGSFESRLKAGQSVVLPDGRTIRPDDIFTATTTADVERPTLLVVEVGFAGKLESILKNSRLLDFQSGGKRQLDYVVHFTPEAIMHTEKYSAWMQSFGTATTHIVVNGTGTAVPNHIGPYRQQVLLNALDEDLFPLLHATNFSGDVDTTTTRGETTESERTFATVIRGKPLQRFSMRDSLTDAKEEESAAITTIVGAAEVRARLKSASAHAKLCHFRECAAANTTGDDKYPAVLFLGTSSARPVVHRNVSGHLLQLSASSSILVDCGEGTYGQMRAFFGTAACERALLNLNAIFLTHDHQDHLNGIYLVVAKRLEAFKSLGIDYRPLVVVCNRNVKKCMNHYSRYFDNLEKFTKIVDISTISSAELNAENPNGKVESRLYFDLTPYLPVEVFSSTAWNLRSVRAVRVHHTRLASGFIFEEAVNGRRVVFSGDTMPCELLVEKARGADLLVHECTFEDGQESMAEASYHSTMGQAVEVGQRMAAKTVILSHFSTRLERIPPLPNYLTKAGNIGVAFDNMLARFDRLELLPKLIPVLREIFKPELIELADTSRVAQRRKDPKSSTNNVKLS